MPEIEGYCKKSRYGTRVSKKRVDGVIHYTCSTPNANVCFNYWVACEGTDAIANAVAVSDGSGTPVSVNYLGTSTDQIGNETLSFTIQ